MRAAEAFPVGEYIDDELEARGWSTKDLAIRMGPESEFDENLLTIEMLIHVHTPGLLLDSETADRLERVFGVSAQTWLNLDKAWQDWHTERT